MTATASQPKRAGVRLGPSSVPTETKAGFTLIELLVVIAIIGILASLLLPVLSNAKESGKSAQCMSNLHQIGVALQVYADENEDYLHYVGRNIPNNGQWTSNPRSTVILAPDHSLAYWGVAYLRYVGSQPRIFRCPSAKTVDEWREDGLTYPADFWLNSSYGINRYLLNPPDPNNPGSVQTDATGNTAIRPMAGLKNPATTIMVQDSAEQKMEGPSDSWGLWPGYSENLTQWKYDLASLYPGRKMELEWFRHRRRGNALWVSGNVTSVRYNKGVDYRWYTGEPAVSPP